MERFLSPGHKLTPPTAPVRPAKGRPPRKVPDGALALGETRLRRSGSVKHVILEEDLASMKRQIEAIKKN